MAVDTKQATGRRTVHYDSLDDILRDAERLAAGEVHMVGNWSLGQVFKHLAGAMNASIDGFPFTLPRLLQPVFRAFMKKSFLERPLKPGFKLPKKAAPLVPDETDTQEGLALLRAAIARVKTETKRMPHPGLGQLTRDEWDRVHMRHAELHMSFAVPVEG